MLKIGCHLSSSKGFLAMGQTAVSIGANTFQFFTRNPRGGNAKPLDVADVEKYLTYAKEHDINTILAHAPYTLNACSDKEELRDFAFRTMQDDLRRLSYLPDAMYNFHPGSHVGQGEKKGIELISELLNRILEENFQTTILLETMAGKGSEVGRNFEELKEILDKVEKNEQMGVCLDTCHVFDGGYDIVNNLDGVLKEFDEIIGLDRLKAIHLNDSLNFMASHKDRHARIGEGNIGLDALVRIVNCAKLRKLPFYLETPNELSGYQKEIELLRQLYKDV